MAKPKPDKADAKAKAKKAKKPKPAPAAVPAEPVFTARPVDAAAPERVAAPEDAHGLVAQGLLARLSGARLCYGEPVTGGEVTVVPVARVRVAGGFGFGRGDGGDDSEGEGGGGAVDAAPIGYIEVGADGARFRAIPDPDRALRTARSVAVTAAATLGALAALRSLTR